MDRTVCLFVLQLTMWNEQTERHGTIRPGIRQDDTPATHSCRRRPFGMALGVEAEMAVQWPRNG